MNNLDTETVVKLLRNNMKYATCIKTIKNVNYKMNTSSKANLAFRLIAIINHSWGEAREILYGQRHYASQYDRVVMMLREIIATKNANRA
jgi:hypothetical protein